MIEGQVNARLEAVVTLKLRGPDLTEVNLDAILDSGFTASLTLPIPLVSKMGLIRQSSSEAMLADGTVRQFDLYVVEVEWEDGWRPVLVSAVGS